MNLPPIVEVRELQEKIQLPSVEEIRKNGLSAELVNKLRDLDSKFDGDLVVFPFVDEATLMVARADSIMSHLSVRYPNTVSLLNYNLRGTVEFLKANRVLSAHRQNKYTLSVPYTDETSKSGPGAWSNYLVEIEVYLQEVCQKFKDDKDDFGSRLEIARKDLADHIHKKYFQKLPRWPSVGSGPNIAKIELSKGGNYPKDGFYIVWSCSGWVSVKDERLGRTAYKAEFSGTPDIKILQIDLDKLNQIEAFFTERGLEESKKKIDEDQGTRDPKLLTWEDFK